jgi:hypothetical protein
MLGIILPISGKKIAVLIRVHTLPMSFVIEPMTHVLGGTAPVLHLSEPLSDALHKLALVLVAAALVKYPAVAIHYSVHKLAFKEVPLRGDHAALTRELAIDEPALLDCTIRCDLDTPTLPVLVRYMVLNDFTEIHDVTDSQRLSQVAVPEVIVLGFRRLIVKGL